MEDIELLEENEPVETTTSDGNQAKPSDTDKSESDVTQTCSGSPEQKTNSAKSAKKQPKGKGPMAVKDVLSPSKSKRRSPARDRVIVAASETEGGEASTAPEVSSVPSLKQLLDPTAKGKAPASEHSYPRNPKREATKPRRGMKITVAGKTGDGEEPGEAGVLECTACGRLVLGPAGLEHHKARCAKYKREQARRRPKPKCPRCKRVFPTQARFAAHEARELACVVWEESDLDPPEALAGLPLCQCDVCGDLFTTIPGLCQHANSHDDPEKAVGLWTKGMIRCFVCNERVLRGKVRYHLWAAHGRKSACQFADHDNVRFHSCTVCGFRTCEDTVFADHVQKHENTRYLECQYCGNRFNTIAVLKKHIRRIHLNLEQFECPQCRKRYKKCNMANQCLENHTGLATYLCKLCSFCCLLPKDITEHLITHHGLVRDQWDLNCQYNGIKTKNRTRLGNWNGLDLAPGALEASGSSLQTAAAAGAAGGIPGEEIGNRDNSDQEENQTFPAVGPKERIGNKRGLRRKKDYRRRSKQELAAARAAQAGAEAGDDAAIVLTGLQELVAVDDEEEKPMGDDDQTGASGGEAVVYLDTAERVIHSSIADSLGLAQTAGTYSTLSTVVAFDDEEEELKTVDVKIENDCVVVVGDGDEELKTIETVDAKIETDDCVVGSDDDDTACQMEVDTVGGEAEGQTFQCQLRDGREVNFVAPAGMDVTHALDVIQGMLGQQ